MKTVVLISGQARSFRHCWRNQYWMLLRKLANPHFYCCVADDADAPALELLRQRFDHVAIELVKQPEPPVPEPAGHPERHAPFMITGGVQQGLRQHRNLKQTWEFFLRAGGQQFDPRDTVFVRLRPDLWFHRFDLPPLPADMFATAITPWWRDCGGVNDRLAFLGAKAAEAWFTTFDRLPELLEMGCPLHQESLIAASLELAGCTVRETLTAHFSFLRADGNGVAEPFEPMAMARFLSAPR